MKVTGLLYYDEKVVKGSDSAEFPPLPSSDVPLPVEYRKRYRPVRLWLWDGNDDNLEESDPMHEDYKAFNYGQQEMYRLMVNAFEANATGLSEMVGKSQVPAEAKAAGRQGAPSTETDSPLELEAALAGML